MKQYLIPIIFLILGLLFGYALFSGDKDPVNPIDLPAVTNELPQSEETTSQPKPPVEPVVTEESDENYCQTLKSRIAGSEDYVFTTNTASRSVISDGYTLQGCIYSINDSYGGWAPFEGQVGAYSLVSHSGILLDEGPLSVVGTSDWISSALAGDDIQYSIDLSFTPPSELGGELILRNENASGEPSRDKTITIPVLF